MAIAGYLGSKDGPRQRVADFAAGYADLNDSDFAQLEQAVVDGRIVARRGV